jgi:hypothetical protein
MPPILQKEKSSSSSVAGNRHGSCPLAQGRSSYGWEVCFYFHLLSQAHSHSHRPPSRMGGKHCYYLVLQAGNAGKEKGRTGKTVRPLLDTIGIKLITGLLSRSFSSFSCCLSGRSSCVTFNRSNGFFHNRSNDSRCVFTSSFSRFTATAGSQEQTQSQGKHAKFYKFHSRCFLMVCY